MIAACLVKGGQEELREYGTTTGEIKELANWLEEQGCQMIAMESTGVYWKPLYNLFELMGLETMVVNAAHMKAVLGRKTDVKDSQWIADLLRHGLLQPSFIPSREQRELRELTRYRKSLKEERSRELNRLQKTLEGCNIKLTSVVKEVNSKSARRLLERVVSNEALNEEEISCLVHVSLQLKAGELEAALEGITTPLQRKMLKIILGHIDDLTAVIAELDELVKSYMAAYEESIAAIDEIPGIARQSAEVILAEIGLDMRRFPSAAHLCSWAGVCPGNNQSAGKKKSGRTRKGDKTLKTMLVQCAKAASRMKSTNGKEYVGLECRAEEKGAVGKKYLSACPPAYLG